MSLDEQHVSMREAIERAHAEDLARERADYEEQRLLESPEAEEARWQGVFRRMSAERPAEHWSERPGVDRRLFGRAAAVADGEIRDRLEDGAA